MDPKAAPSGGLAWQRCFLKQPSGAQSWQAFHTAVLGQSEHATECSLPRNYRHLGFLKSWTTKISQGKKQPFMKEQMASALAAAPRILPGGGMHRRAA